MQAFADTVHKTFAAITAQLRERGIRTAYYVEHHTDCSMNLEWVDNNVHGLLTVWTVSGTADFDLVTTGDFSHEVNFPTMQAFTADAVSAVLYAVDNTAALIAVHNAPTDTPKDDACPDDLGSRVRTWFAAVGNELSERGVKYVSYECDYDGDEKELMHSLLTDYASCTVTVFTDDPEAYFTSAHADGVTNKITAKSVKLEDFERTGFEVQDSAIAAVDVIVNIIAANRLTTAGGASC